MLWWLDASGPGCSGFGHFGTGMLRDWDPPGPGGFVGWMLQNWDAPGPGSSGTGMLKDRFAPGPGCSVGWMLRGVGGPKGGQDAAGSGPGRGGGRTGRGWGCRNREQSGVRGAPVLGAGSGAAAAAVQVIGRERGLPGRGRLPPGWVLPPTPLPPWSEYDPCGPPGGWIWAPRHLSERIRIHC